MTEEAQTFGVEPIVAKINHLLFDRIQGIKEET